MLAVIVGAKGLPRVLRRAAASQLILVGSCDRTHYSIEARGRFASVGIGDWGIGRGGHGNVQINIAPPPQTTATALSMFLQLPTSERAALAPTSQWAYVLVCVKLHTFHTANGRNLGSVQFCVYLRRS